MAYREMYEIEVRHDGLHKYRLVRGSDWYVVEQKAKAQQKTWDEMWQKKQQREQTIQKGYRGINSATEMTKKAQSAVAVLQNTLKHTLMINDAIDWEKLKDFSNFTKPEPQLKLLQLPQEPLQASLKYQPKIGLLEFLFKSFKEKEINRAETLFQNDFETWEDEVSQCNNKNNKIKEKYEIDLASWKDEKETFYAKQKESNNLIDERKEEYLAKNPEAIFDYCDMVLSNSIYPDYFPQEYELEYIDETKTLVVEYSFPNLDDMPRVKEVKYVKTNNDYKTTYLTDSTVQKMYDELLYQITLRTIHELFEADVANAIDAVVFNGWVKAIDKSIGQEVNTCVLSVQATKDIFMEINLALVDPKDCFKKLKGVGSSKLHGMSAVQPILNISKEDKRFVSAYNLADTLDETENLASMDWQDFENLIREVFEKEFNQTGGEVKITQASRDGGVDAVAFDPDPIRGGKIVIQAKRYTNVVGVSAVRDLYGTLMNEGATKGILVTTADYGPDAYEFAKGKPITLLNGSNLLFLLEKHGHKAKIDIKEAKKILNQ